MLPIFSVAQLNYIDDSFIYLVSGGFSLAAGPLEKLEVVFRERKISA